MKHYKILNTNFSLSDFEVEVNGHLLETKLTTLKALELFLNSKGEIVSKDEIIKYVWDNIIVSDASAFKQAQAVKKILINAGLPKDVMENVYGKGYRLKYEVNIVDKEVKESVKSRPHFIFSYKYIFALIVLVLIVVKISYFNNGESITGSKILNAERRKSMVNLMNSDWEQGLIHVNEFIDNNHGDLTKDDLAFLYRKKGKILNHLQEFEKSIQNSQKALEIYEQLNLIEEQGMVHLNLAKSYNYLSRIEGNKAKKQEHINAAIKLFSQIGAKEKLIDAQMQLAYHMQKYGNYESAISLFEKIVKEAQNIDDKVGKMIAINNLATTYQILNQNDKAIALGEKGLALTLEIGKGSYIASSYSFLSDLYQNQYKSKQAMNMLEQAIKYQLSSNDFSHLNPKLINLNYLLVQTYQFDKAKKLNDTIKEYAKSLGKGGYIAILSMYKGLNEARQKHWHEAEIDLNEAVMKLNRLNFKFKKPFNLAYLALANYFNNNHLQAVENAMQVINTKDCPKQSRAIAALALAYAYGFLEKTELSDKWFIQAQETLDPKWLFEYKLFLELKLERQLQSHSILISQTQNEILEVSKKMHQLSMDAKVDDEIFDKLEKQIIKKIHLNNLNKEDL